MNKKDEALRLALGVLLDIQNDRFERPERTAREAMSAIREALAQPEQEPLRDLTDEEIHKVWGEYWYAGEHPYMDFARAIIAAMKGEK